MWLKDTMSSALAGHAPPKAYASLNCGSKSRVSFTRHWGGNIASILYSGNLKTHYGRWWFLGNSLGEFVCKGLPSERSWVLSLQGSKDLRQWRSWMVISCSSTWPVSPERTSETSWTDAQAPVLFPSSFTAYYTIVFCGRGAMVLAQAVFFIQMHMEVWVLSSITPDIW